MDDVEAFLRAVMNDENQEIAVRLQAADRIAAAHQAREARQQQGEWATKAQEMQMRLQHDERSTSQGRDRKE